MICRQTRHRSPGPVRAARLGYAGLAVADTVLAAVGTPAAQRARRVTKPLLMPVLVAGQGRSPGRTRTALALSGAGDVALLGSSSAAFTVGLGAFLAAQVAWVRALRGRTARPGAVERRPVLAVPYALAATALLAYLWPRAGRDRAPVAVYAAALTATAVAAADTGDPWTAAGGTLFLASDALIALDRFGGVRLPAHEGWVMGTYTLAQALLARGTAGPAVGDGRSHGRR